MRPFRRENPQIGFVDPVCLSLAPNQGPKNKPKAKTSNKPNQDEDVKEDFAADQLKKWRRHDALGSTLWPVEPGRPLQHWGRSVID